MNKQKLTLNDLASFAHHLSQDSIEKNDSNELKPLSYMLMLPRKNKAWAGFGIQQSIRYQDHKFTIEDAKGNVREITSDNPFESLDQILDAKVDYFFMVSLDLHRPLAKNELPTMIWVQAQAEILIDITETSPYRLNKGVEVYQTLVTQLNQQVIDDNISPLNFSDNKKTTDWITENDEVFVNKLNTAIQALQKENGKIIVTRTYSTSLNKQLDPFRLFEIYSQLESSCAAAHFFQLDTHTFSLGCTPENIFSLRNNNLDFDVIASTRGISPDPEKDALWDNELKSNTKELKEHNMALGRYQKRLGQLCKEDSVVMDHHLDTRKFRHVRHLYSHLYGELLDGINVFDLIQGSSPALCTYPEQLIPVADDGLTPTNFYGGMVGRTGSGFTEADVFLNLRSFFFNHNELRTMGGVGVVRESIAEQELVEVKNKLRCVMEAEALWKNESND